MTEELLAAIAAKTNAIDAVNEALKAEWTMIEELDKLVRDPNAANYLEQIKAHVASLKALNSALPAAVVANVAPATAGPVGKSAQEHVFEQADAFIAEGLVRIAEGAAKAQELTSLLRDMFETLHTSASAVGAAKSMKEAETGA